MPTTGWPAGRDFCFITQTMASSGLVMQMTKASGQCVLMPSATSAITPAFLPIRSSRRHAGHAREAGGDDDDVRPFDRVIVAAAGHVGVEAVDRAGLHDVERLAGGDAAEHVEQDDVAEFLQADQVGERAADVAGADEGDLVAGHLVSLQRARGSRGANAVTVRRVPGGPGGDWLLAHPGAWRQGGLSPHHPRVRPASWPANAPARWPLAGSAQKLPYFVCSVRLSSLLAIEIYWIRVGLISTSNIRIRRAPVRSCGTPVSSDAMSTLSPSTATQ